MFDVGERVVYGNVGVCEVEKVGTIDMAGMPKDRMYYTLNPVFEKGSTVFTPVDNTKIIIRPVISEEEARELIDQLTEVDTLWVPNEKKREEIYKKALRSCNCKEWAKMIKTLYLRRESRVAEGKKMTAGDKKYCHAAEEYFFGEMAVALGMDRMEVEEFTEKIIQNKTNSSGMVQA